VGTTSFTLQHPPKKGGRELQQNLGTLLRALLAPKWEKKALLKKETPLSPKRKKGPPEEAEGKKVSPEGTPLKGNNYTPPKKEGERA